MSPAVMFDSRSPIPPVNELPSDSCSFNTGSTPLTRSKARLFKQRRSSKASSSNNFVGDSGINPFRSVNLLNGDLFDRFDKNVNFVFGVSNSGNGVRVSSNFNLGDRDIGQEVELVNGIKKLDIKHRGKECSGLSKNGESLFVFKSGLKDLDEKEGGVDDGKIGGFGSEPVEENIFVFDSGKSKEFEVNGVEKDVPLSSFCFSTSGVQVDGEDVEVGSVSMERNAEFVPASFSSTAEFKLPGFDSSLSFSAVLPNGLDNKDSGERTRVSKDQKLKKMKTKLRQAKVTKKQPLRKPVSSQSVVQEEEIPGSYSPMDFSPYEDSTSKYDVPPGVHQTTDQTKVKNENLYTKSQPDVVFTSSGLGVSFTDSSAGTVSSNTSGHDGNDAQSCNISNSASKVAEKFAFTASTSAQNHETSVKRQQKKKYRLKNADASITRDAYVSSTPLPSRLQRDGANFFVFESKNKSQTGEGQDQSYESAINAAEKACDKWRKRGNEAYEKGELSKAEDLYTWGVNCIPPGDNESGVAFRSLVRCYSNRAATRMALGRVREAILDCLTAVKMDPTFNRAQMRAGNCYLLLGELEEAMQCFGKSMDSVNGICLDRQVAILGSEGIQKSQKVMDCMNRCAEILKLRTSDAAASALALIAEAMSISSYSEKLLEMKADALCMLGKHEEAITLCQQSLDFAEKNFTPITSGEHEVNSSCLDVRFWRHHISSKCYFHLGRLDESLDLLEKPEFANKTLESPYQLAVTIRELLKQKNAGNIAFQTGKHAEAVEHYTSAISSSAESRPFAAICFCNRAAAYQALGQIADAIADCSLAIALNDDYAKAVSRRATLHEMIRDYKQAAADLQRLVSLLEKQSLEKPKQSGSGNGKELRQFQQRLSSMEEESKKDVPLDLYLILGTKKTDPASEVKKAYRKAALRHHPDKACQSLVRNDVGDEGHRWKDITELVHKDSDKLFKMIGEAYAVLSDPTKREEYDDAEDMRKALKESNDLRRTSRRHSEYYSQSHPFERSNSRRHWQEQFNKAYSHRRW